MTFYALSSGPGLSGIAVIRVSGSETVNVIKHLTNSSLPKPKEATLKKFINKNNELIDEGILLWFPGPNSYTGEDMAEFHVHGSRAVIEAIQSSISEVSNCRLASPGVHEDCFSEWKNRFTESRRYFRLNFIRNRNSEITSYKNNGWQKFKNI